MKRRSVTILIFVITIIIFTGVPEAIAGRGCTGPNVDPENYIMVNKNAPGTKYNVTLTIYYVDGASCAMSPVPTNLKDMHFFVRVEGNTIHGLHDFGGAELLHFGGIGECIPYWSGGGYSGEAAIVAQQQAINDFFKFVAIPHIYGCDPFTSDPDQMCPPFALKSINKIVENDMITDDPKFTIMDFVIAIKD